MEDGNTLVCVKVSKLPTPGAGSVQTVCQECEAPVWVSRDGITFITIHPEVYVACVECVLGSTDVDPQQVRMVPGAPRRLRRWFKTNKEEVLQLLKVKDLDESE